MWFSDWQNLVGAELYLRYLQNGIRVLVIFAAALLLTRISSKTIPKLRERIVETMKRHGDGSEIELEKRAQTISSLIRKTLVVVIWVVAGLTALQQAGFQIGPILAGAGIAGVAVGFGAQYLVRDVISGLFLILENQVRVNDVVIINGTGGLVEEINLRTTVIRGLDGTVHIFPNGSITSISNMTREFSYYVFDIGVAYKEDPDRVIEVVKQLADELMQEEPYRSVILEPLEVLGVDKFADSAVIIKARIKTLPLKQWMVGREMNRRMKKRFDEVGIEIPFPHRTLYFGDTSKPFEIKIEGIPREEIKQAVREVLQECGVLPVNAVQSASVNNPGELPGSKSS